MSVHQAARGGLLFTTLALVAASIGSDDPKRTSDGSQGPKVPATKASEPGSILELLAERDLFQVDDPKPGDPVALPEKPTLSRPAEPRGIPADIANPNLLNSHNLKPVPPAAIPDDPPPHEGALIDVPYLIEPPDLIVIEVLEALPGRPIQGDHLVRPDGTVGLGFFGDIHVRGLTREQAKVKIILQLRKFLSDEVLGLTNTDIETGKILEVDPAETDRVFVDIGAYNSKNYFVSGDFQKPGRLPITGSETVLDVINHAGGLTETADPKDLRLIRPAREGKPARVYPIDLEAIQERGDQAANLQIFPGDRLHAGRDETVKRTVAINRKMAPLNTALNTLLQYSFTMRNLLAIDEPVGASSSSTIKLDGNTVGGHRTITPADLALRQARMREGVDYLWKVMKPGAPAMGEEEFREGLLRIIQTPAPKP